MRWRFSFEKFKIMNGLRLTKITTNRIAKGAAECEPIVLREWDFSRLVFKPMLVENENNPTNNIRWYFVYQKKKKSEEWNDIKEETLSKLKSWEWYQLELRSEELSKLISHLNSHIDLFNQYGIQDWKQTFISSQNIDKTLIELWDINNKNIVQSAFTNLDKTSLLNIENLISITKFKNIINEFEKNVSNSQEKNFWQPFFKRENWILSQIFSTPYIYFEDEMYLWWKIFKNQGWVITDFSYINSKTDSISLIEIKEPTASLVSNSEYRWEGKHSLYSLHWDLSWAITQCLNQKNTFLNNFHNISDWDFFSYNTRSILIIWNLWSLDETKKKSFELQRWNMKDVEIVTFDELLEKIKIMYNLLSWEKYINELDNESEEIEDYF